MNTDSFSTVPLKVPGATVHTHLSSRSSQIRTQTSTFGDRVKKMFNTVGQQIAHHSEHLVRSADVLHPDVGDQPGSLARTSPSTGFEGVFFTSYENLLFSVWKSH